MLLNTDSGACVVVKATGEDAADVENDVAIASSVDDA